jgi:hypothetical protein
MSEKRPTAIAQAQEKLEACKSMADCCRDAVQLKLVRSLVATQVVHASSDLEANAQSIRTYDCSGGGDAERRDDLRVIRDLTLLLVDLCDLGDMITGKLEKLGAA